MFLLKACKYEYLYNYWRCHLQIRNIIYDMHIHFPCFGEPPVSGVSDADMWHHSCGHEDILDLTWSKCHHSPSPSALQSWQKVLILWLVTQDWSVSWYWSQSHNNDICVLTRRSILGSDFMMKSDCSLFLWLLYECSEYSLNASFETSWRHPDVILQYLLA